jgi:hypothetical protein
LPLTNYKKNNGQYGNLLKANKALIGARFSNGNGAFFKGAIDELRIYNRALEISELTSLYDENGTSFKSISEIETLIIGENSDENSKERTKNAIRIYPNMEKDHIYMDSEKNYFGYKIKIVSKLNKVVFKKTINQLQYYIDLKTWNGKGNYFVQVYDRKGNLIDVNKIILQ